MRTGTIRGVCVCVWVLKTQVTNTSVRFADTHVTSECVWRTGAGDGEQTASRRRDMVVVGRRGLDVKITAVKIPSGENDIIIYCAARCDEFPLVAAAALDTDKRTHPYGGMGKKKKKKTFSSEICIKTISTRRDTYTVVRFSSARKR